jgi:dTMP kinase
MGKFIVIDGLDGSGKGTQTDILVEKLKSEGKRVRTLSFPVYENDSSMFVRMYLDGKFGKNPSDTNAFAASMFFACDRYISFKTDWLKDIEDPDTYVIANRYTSANAVHQLSKLPREEWDEFLKWLWDFEFSRLCLPVPDATIYLELPPVLSLSLVRSRSAETGRKMDIHELDTSYMEKCYDAALFSCKALGWKQIKCYEGDKIRTIDDISKQIYDEVSKL